MLSTSFAMAYQPEKLISLSYPLASGEVMCAPSLLKNIANQLTGDETLG